MTAWDFRVSLKATPAGPDGLGRDKAYRLRVALKRLWRCFGLKCVALETAPANPATTAKGKS